MNNIQKSIYQKMFDELNGFHSHRIYEQRNRFLGNLGIAMIAQFPLIFLLSKPNLIPQASVLLDLSAVVALVFAVTGYPKKKFTELAANLYSQPLLWQNFHESINTVQKHKEATRDTLIITKESEKELRELGERLDCFDPIEQSLYPKISKYLNTKIHRKAAWEFNNKLGRSPNPKCSACGEPMLFSKPSWLRLFLGKGCQQCGGPKLPL